MKKLLFLSIAIVMFLGAASVKADLTSGFTKDSNVANSWVNQLTATDYGYEYTDFWNNGKAKQVGFTISADEDRLFGGNMTVVNGQGNTHITLSTDEAYSFEEIKFAVSLTFNFDDLVLTGFVFDLGKVSGQASVGLYYQLEGDEDGEWRHIQDYTFANKDQAFFGVFTEDDDAFIKAIQVRVTGKGNADFLQGEGVLAARGEGLGGGGGGGSTPEPATLAILGLGLAGLGLARRRNK